MTKKNQFNFFKNICYPSAGLKIHKRLRSDGSKKGTVYLVTRMCHDNPEPEELNHSQIKEKIRKKSFNCASCSSKASHSTARKHAKRIAEQPESPSLRIYKKVIAKRKLEKAPKVTKQSPVVLWLMAMNKLGRKAEQG